MIPGKNYPGLKLLETPLTHLGELPARLSQAYGDRPALQVQRGDGIFRWSYREFAQVVARMARRLEGLGLGPGDRFVVSGENSPEWVAAYFAVVATGAIAVPLDPMLTDEELQVLIAHCSPQGAFASERLLAPIQKAMGDDKPAIGLVPSEFRLPEGSVEEPPYAVPESAGAIASILYTSGTTGKPKGVMLTHRNFLFDATRCIEIIYVEPGDNSFCLLPLQHAYSFTCLLIAMLSGVPATLPVSLKPDSVVATMAATRVTILPAVPLLIDHLARGIQDKLTQLPPAKARVVKGLIRLSAALRPILGAGVSRRLCAPILSQLGGLRLVVAGGAPLIPEAAEFFHGLGVTVLNGYGLTETAPVLTLTPTPWRPGDGVGKPLRGVEVRLKEPNSEGVGEVEVRSECVMAGYYLNPEATDAVLADGWLNTQDLGRLDERGVLHLMGRSKNVIVLPSGKNVYPEDLEVQYGQSPLIQEICVITGREADGTEYPFGVLVPDRKAFAEQHPDAPAFSDWNALVGKEIMRLSRGLPDYKRLKRFELIGESLPTTTTRKIRRHLVQAAYSFQDGKAVRAERFTRPPLTTELPVPES